MSVPPNTPKRKSLPSELDVFQKFSLNMALSCRRASVTLLPEIPLGITLIIGTVFFFKCAQCDPSVISTFTHYCKSIYKVSLPAKEDPLYSAKKTYFIESQQNKI